MDECQYGKRNDAAINITTSMATHARGHALGALACVWCGGKLARDVGRFCGAETLHLVADIAPITYI